MLANVVLPVVLLALSPEAPPIAQERDDASRLARVDLIVEEAMHGSGAGALVVLAELGGERLLERGYGSADGGRDDAAKFVFRVGALSEVFTAVCLLQLEAEERLDLDADVATVLPGLAWEGKTIPMRALLAHTSGLPSGATFLHSFAARRARGPQEAAANTPPALDANVAEIVAVLAALALESEPQSCFAYEHTNHVVAAAVLETVTSQSLAQCFAERIFAPLGMSSTSFREDGPPIVAEDEVTQVLGGEEVSIPAHVEHFDEELLCSSAADLVRFVRGLVERELLDDAQFRALTESVVLADGTETGYGLGLGRTMLDERACFTCGGVLAGSSVQLAHYPELDMTVAVLADDADTHVQRVERRVTRAVLDVPEPGVHDWPLTQRELERYVGDYQIGCNRLEVRSTGDHLTLAWGDRPTARLLHQGRHVFVAGADPELRLTFELEDDRAAGSFELDDHGLRSVATRFGR